jgi:hypothetical protein
MAERQVTRTGKDEDGDITKLCNHASWGAVTKADAIWQIESKIHTYFVQEPGTARVNVQVVARNGRKHLQTTADESSKNNLDNLPDC